MVWKSVGVICVGASLGALLRWWLGMRLNGLYPSLPPGTLLANLIGGYVIGIAFAIFTALPSLSPEWRLLVVTGFCGGLTTFSTFSIEVVAMLGAARFGEAFAIMFAHLLGSFAATAIGIATVRALMGAGARV